MQIRKGKEREKFHAYQEISHSNWNRKGCQCGA